MQSRILLLGAAMVLAVAATPGGASAQVRTIEDDEWCERQRWSNDDGERYCEVREMTLSADRSVIRVNGRTNGGLNITLTGKRWQGAGLDARTTNGGVRMYIPEDYSAMLESGTVNGSFRIDFPITIQGRLDSRRITARLGDGGTAIRASTTTGGVTIKHKG